MSSTFVLRIELGNDAMKTGEDVAEALRGVAENISVPSDLEDGDYGDVRDFNGNRVGSYEVQ